MRRIKRVVFVVTVTAFMVWGAVWRSFQSLAVCSHCGAHRHSTKWLVPWTELTVFESHEIEENDFSAFASKHGRTKEGGHHWVFVGGNGGGFMASGPGIPLLTATRVVEIRALLEECFRSDESLGASMMEAALDVRRAEAVMDLAVVWAVHWPQHFSTPAEFKRWRLEHADEISAVLTRRTDGRPHDLP